MSSPLSLKGTPAHAPSHAPSQATPSAPKGHDFRETLRNAPVVATPPAAKPMPRVPPPARPAPSVPPASLPPTPPQPLKQPLPPQVQPHFPTLPSDPGAPPAILPPATKPPSKGTPVSVQQRGTTAANTQHPHTPVMTDGTKRILEQLDAVAWQSVITSTGLQALARVYPFTLIAYGYLSERRVASASVIPSGAQPRLASTNPPADTPATQVQMTGFDASVSLAGAHQAVRGDVPLAAVIPLSTATPRATASADQAGVLELTNALALAAWPERLLRMCPNPEGGSDVWLRDYHIDSRHASALGAALAQKARASGHVIRAVYLNGHCIWTNPSLQLTQET